MPLLGLSPFLRSTLGSRINRGHNLETIRVIVRQFIFAPISTSFFPSLGIFALFRRNGFSYNIFIIHVSRHRLKAFFHFNVSFSISFFRSYFPAAQKAPFRMPLCYFPFTLYQLFHFDIYTNHIVYISSFSQLSFLSLAVSLLIP